MSEAAKRWGTSICLFGAKCLKESGPIASDFFQTFWVFGIGRKLIFFPITPVAFYSWKMYRLEDVNENVTSYVNHN